jgi:hypothetical protein
MIRRQPFPPVPLEPIRAGEIDGRSIDVGADLGPIGDSIPSIDVVSIDIKRRDGFPMSAYDLVLAGPDWPMTLDDTGLIVTIGLKAPVVTAGYPWSGRGYQLTLTVNKTMQSRLFIRDLYIDVLACMG